VRFVLAIVALVLAAGSIVLGIAQRTVFLEPASTSLSATITDNVRFAVIEPSALSAFPGSQTITISGADTVFAAYGRTGDVTAWLGDESYVDIRRVKGTAKLSSKLTQVQPVVVPPAGEKPTNGPAVAPEARQITNPVGSDLWLQEFGGKTSLTRTINVPAGISVIVASDGTKPAPTKITLTWPIDNSTPMAGPLIIGGGVLFIVGLILYLWALLHLRRSHGPRRNLPKGPRMPRLPRAPRPKSIKAREITGSRRAITRKLLATVPVLVVTGLVLSGCSADFWPSSAATPGSSATPDATSVAKTARDVPPPAVTLPQLERIVSRIAALTADADAKLDGDTLAARFTGPALEQRLANYKIRAAVADYPALPALPASPLTLTLPQQSSTWPRVVMTVIQNADNAAIAPTAIVLRQETPRSEYLVEYAVQLEAAAKVPDVAPATIGAPIVAPDSKLLLLPPGGVAAAYADILLQGEASPSYGLFKAAGDTFRTQVGLDKKNQKRAALPTTASIAFAAAVGTGTPVALATNDSGSIVAVSLTETEIVKPVEKGATVSPEGASKALSGVSATAKGIQSTYGDQLLFHVPAVGSSEKIVLLGFAQGLISSTELP
jgi:hypothetical protein